MNQCAMCKTDATAYRLAICACCRDRAYQLEKGLRDNSHYSDWAIMLEAVYQLTGRGLCLTGSMLYGKPRPTDRIRIGDYLATVSGVDRYSIAMWWWPGVSVGVILKDWQSIHKRDVLIEPPDKDVFTKGLTITGWHDA